MLRDLLGLDGVGEFRREGDMGDGNVVQNDVEAGSASSQVLPDETRDLEEAESATDRITSDVCN